MRNRTEMVTTTFVDSEDSGDSEDGDSEEDWRPTTQGGKRRSSKTSIHRRAKRKARNVSYNSSSEKSNKSQDRFYKSSSRSSSQKEAYNNSNRVQAATSKDTEEQSQTNDDATDSIELYVCKKDLCEDFTKGNNRRLCLWRREEENENLLQKYIRIKTDRPDEFIFTSSSVYSSWDEATIGDFVAIKVRTMPENSRRVMITNPGDLMRLMSKDGAAQDAEKSDEQSDDEQSFDSTQDIDVKYVEQDHLSSSEDETDETESSASRSDDSEYASDCG